MFCLTRVVDRFDGLQLSAARRARSYIPTATTTTATTATHANASTTGSFGFVPLQTSSSSPLSHIAPSSARHFGCIPGYPHVFPSMPQLSPPTSLFSSPTKAPKVDPPLKKQQQQDSIEKNEHRDLITSPEPAVQRPIRQSRTHYATNLLTSSGEHISDVSDQKIVRVHRKLGSLKGSGTPGTGPQVGTGVDIEELSDKYTSSSDEDNGKKKCDSKNVLQLAVEWENGHCVDRSIGTATISSSEPDEKSCKKVLRRTKSSMCC
jgi:hypothetical protein